MTAKKSIFGFTGKILRADLTAGTVTVEEPGPEVYRKYPGGSALGAYYCLREIKPGTDALSSDNILVFATGPATGAALAGASRFCVTAKSPLTGCLGDTQCGGIFGPQLKWSGFDAVIVTGRADKPVFLWAHDGEAEIRPADKLWGQFTGDTRDALAAELGDSRIAVACIGPAGENRVRFANISGGGSDYAGRTGMGAVMGSKNLKAIVCRGGARPEFCDPDTVKRIAKTGAASFKKSGFPQLLRAMGTSAVVSIQNATGGLPTRNFSRGSFDGAKNITGETMKAKFECGTEACFACVVRCKRLVKAEEPYPIVPEYGGPEYESIAMLGSNLENGDLAAVCFANQLCNAHGLDTITTGAVIAFAMECYENGLISRQQADGLDLKFGDAEVIHRLIEMISRRDGLGDILANGLEAGVKAFGSSSAEYAIHVKNNALPAHMPQIKSTMALIYAVNPFGADHLSCEHDWFIQALGPPALGMSLDAKRNPDVLDYEKVRMVIYSQFYYSLLDTLCLCAFCWGPGSLFSYQNLVDLVTGATGWETNFWELIKSGERRINMMRAFNEREGVDSQFDRLPKRVFKPMPGPGAGQGRHVSPEDLNKAIQTYYGMMNWDKYSGGPTPEKLQELGLAWISG